MPIDFQKFCREDKGTRYAMDTPFVVDSFQYGTDGLIVIRTPIIAPNTLAGEIRFPPVKELFVDWPDSRDFIAWPDATYCMSCHGFGVVPDEIAVEKQCPTCGGKISAKMIDGEIAVFQVGVQFIQTKYDLLIRSLHRPRFRPVAYLHRNSPMRFIFYGGQGLVMPTTEP